jgi:hypothetical protein
VVSSSVFTSDITSFVSADRNIIPQFPDDAVSLTKQLPLSIYEVGSGVGTVVGIAVVIVVIISVIVSVIVGVIVIVKSPPTPLDVDDCVPQDDDETVPNRQLSLSIYEVGSSAFTIPIKHIIAKIKSIRFIINPPNQLNL